MKVREEGAGDRRRTVCLFILWVVWVFSISFKASVLKLVWAEIWDLIESVLERIEDF